MSTRAKSSSKPKPEESSGPGFFRRINLRFPWLKVAVLIFVVFVMILDLTGFSISKLSNLDQDFPTTPMAKHLKATERELKGKKVVALTFDDGPSADTTPSLLDILSEKNVVATFFMLGYMAENNPEIVKRVEREGHEVANHTMYHQNLYYLSSEEIEEDYDESLAVFKSIIKHAPALTRAPYGNLNDAAIEVIDTPFIRWSVDPQDWKSKDPDSILSITLEQVHDGAIILIHDIYPTSVEAAAMIIDSLHEAGYEFATVSELARFRGVELEDGEEYLSFEP